MSPLSISDVTSCNVKPINFPFSIILSKDLRPAYSGSNPK